MIVIQERPSPALAAVVALSLLTLAGCDHFDLGEAASHLPPYQSIVDSPKNVIDTALDHCPDKTEEQEAICVKQALSDRHVTVAELIAMVPHCAKGHVCLYRHTSKDRLGYVKAFAAGYVARWEITFDLAHSARSGTDVPVTVEER